MQENRKMLVYKDENESFKVESYRNLAVCNNTEYRNSGLGMEFKSKICIEC